MRETEIMKPEIQLPTDNFYKFCSIFGLLSVLAVLYGIGWLVIITEQEIFDLQVSVAETNVDLDHLVIAQDRADNKIDFVQALKLRRLDLCSPDSVTGRVGDASAAQDNKTKKCIEENIDALLDTDSLESYLIPLRASNNKVRKQVEINQLKLARVESLARRLSTITIAGVCALILAIFLSYYGFINWYRKVQVPADKTALLRSEERPFARRYRRANT